MKAQRVTQRAVVVAIILFGVVISAAQAAAQVVGCRTDDEDRHRLLVISDMKTLSPQLFRTFDGKIVDSEPSITGKYVGAMVVDPKSQNPDLPAFVFHVLDKRGKTVASVAKAQGFAFSPDDRYVAVTTGSPYEGATGFRPEATQVLDLQTGKRWEVPEFKDATEIDWTNLPDEGLTLVAKKPLGTSKVWKYRLKNRLAKATKWKSVHFSPDGEYYYMTPREVIEAGMCKVGDRNDSCIRAFSRSNKEMKLNLRQRFRRAIGWAGPRGHDLLVRDGFGKDEEHMQIDLATGRMAKIKERLNRRWKLRRGVRAIDDESKGKIRLRMNELMEELEENSKKRRERRRKRRGY